ncbi:MAG TPA: hypothetical protein PLN92_07225 [Thermotogota bacterium]|nr:hypothetical protein [Thermotogota bacterium]
MIDRHDSIMDKEGMDFLEIRPLLSRFSPSSHYGKRLFNNPYFFSPGQEDALTQHYRRVKKLEGVLPGVEKEGLKRCLTELKNISHSVEKLENNELPSVVDFFEIKKFYFFFKRLLGLLEDFSELKEWYGFFLQPDVWTMLDPRDTNQFFFSIDSDYAVELRREMDKYQNLEKVQLRKICDQLEKRYDLSLKNRTDFLLERSDIRNHALRRSDHFTILSETAFSVHYKVIRSQEDEDYSEQINRLTGEMGAEEKRYRIELMDGLSVYTDYLRSQMKAVGEFDRDIALIEYKDQYSACWPDINQNGEFQIQEGVFQDVRDFCVRKGYRYDPVNIRLNKGVTVIVGANMGGKTTALKNIGQLYAAFAMGLPITAKVFSSPLFQSINCVFRSKEEEGLSGFAMEVKRIKPVFEAGCHLNLIDEFGSATNPKEGDALASAVVKHLASKESITVFVTHFSGPLLYGNQRYQTGFLRKHDDLLNSQNIYLYIDHRLEPIESDHVPQAAIEISQALGLPSEVIEEAKGIAGYPVC